VWSERSRTGVFRELVGEVAGDVDNHASVRRDVALTVVRDCLRTALQLRKLGKARRHQINRVAT